MLFLGMLSALVHAGETSTVLMRCYFWECCDATGRTAGHMLQA